MSHALARPAEPLAFVPPCPPSPLWVLADVIVPETNPHRDRSERVRALLRGWAERTGRGAQVVSNLAMRWDAQHPTVGLDPDVALLDPPPPEGAAVGSLLLWKAGHVVPPLAIEIVSASNADKDYTQAPQKYASLGVQELWVLDPELQGPATKGGPYAVQVWTRPAGGGLTRVYAGEGPAYSPYVGAWISLDEAGQVILADDAVGRQRWWTPEEAALREKQAALWAKQEALLAQEAERQAKEAEQQAKEAALLAQEAERQAKEAALKSEEAALARVAELEAELGRMRQGLPVPQGNTG